MTGHGETVHEDVQAFRELVIEAAGLRQQRKIAAANRTVTAVHKIAERLRSSDEGRAAYEALLADNSSAVKLHVAGSLLPDERAVDALERRVAEGGDLGRTAEFVLATFRLEQKHGYS